MKGDLKMNSNNSNASSGGISFFGLLAIVLITLKLLGVIDWAWWIVLAPLWGSVAFTVLIIVVIVAIVRRW